MFVYKLLMVLAVTGAAAVGDDLHRVQDQDGQGDAPVAQDQDGARLMGINVNGTIAFTFGLGGAGRRGRRVVLPLPDPDLLRHRHPARPDRVHRRGAGGIGNLTGAVVGGVIIGIIQALEGGAQASGSNWSQSVVFLILIVLMVSSPKESSVGPPLRRCDVMSTA